MVDDANATGIDKSVKKLSAPVADPKVAPVISAELPKTPTVKTFSHPSESIPPMELVAAGGSKTGLIAIVAIVGLLVIGGGLASYFLWIDDSNGDTSSVNGGTSMGSGGTDDDSGGTSGGSGTGGGTGDGGATDDTNLPGDDTTTGNETGNDSAVSDPCSNITCNSYCTEETRSHNGTCVVGECVYDSEVCDVACEPDGCIADDDGDGVLDNVDTCVATCDGALDVSCWDGDSCRASIDGSAAYLNASGCCLPCLDLMDTSCAECRDLSPNCEWVGYQNVGLPVEPEGEELISGECLDSSSDYGGLTVNELICDGLDLPTTVYDIYCEGGPPENCFPVDAVITYYGQSCSSSVCTVDCGTIAPDAPHWCNGLVL